MAWTAKQKAAFKKERRNFSAKTYLKVKKEFDRQRKLPRNAPVWYMNKTEWNAISSALKIAADHSK
jgi:predicted DNA-binding protein (MmcQ/YjbR family)